MSGFYGYTYIRVWCRASSALLPLVWHAMELGELFPVEGQGLPEVSRDSRVGCVDELSSHRSLPSAPARLYWRGGGSSGRLSCSPAPLGMGWFSAFPSPTIARVAGGLCWPREPGDTGWAPKGMERLRVPVPDKGGPMDLNEQPLPTAGQTGTASLWKGWIYGMELEQKQETFFALYQKKIPAPHPR